MLEFVLKIVIDLIPMQQVSVEGRIVGMVVKVVLMQRRVGEQLALCGRRAQKVLAHGEAGA